MLKVKKDISIISKSLRLQDEVNKIGKYYEINRYKNEWPKIIQINYSQSTSNTYLATTGERSPIFLVIRITLSVESIQSTTKVFATPNTIEIVIRLSKEFPLEVPIISCASGVELLPKNLKKDEQFFPYWLENQWPENYFVCDFVNDIIQSFHLSNHDLLPSKTPALIHVPSAPDLNDHVPIQLPAPPLDISKSLSDVSNDDIIVKCEYNGEMKRFLLSSNITSNKYDILKKIIIKAFNVHSNMLNDSQLFQLEYIDSDGDRCLISSEQELDEAIFSIKKKKIDTLYIKIPSQSNGEKKNNINVLNNPSTESFQSIRHILLEDIKLDKIIGQGSTCKVYKGSWLGTEVAVKRLTNSDLNQMKKEYDQEVKMMNHIKSHPCIVMLLAVISSPLCLIFEYLPYTLFELIQGNTSNDKKLIPKFTSNWRQRLQMMLDTCRGLQFLHSFGIVHRNLLVTETLKIKVADFGIARITRENELMTGGIGTCQWMAPEVITSQNYSVSADIYSFGIVLWEISEGKTPFMNMTAAQVAISVVNEDLRPVISPSTPKALRELISSCWQKDPIKRPTAEKINDFLTKCLSYSK